MLESSSTAPKATWSPAKLDHFLAQVQALVEMHNLQRKELLETKSALLEAQSELNAAKRSMAPQSIQQTETADLTTNSILTDALHAVPEEAPSATPIENDVEMKWSHSTAVQGSKSTYSPQPPQSKDLRAFDSNTIQKLLEEINSCIALLEE
ncbi:MAG: hypothetical protein ISQ97_06255 [Flavobacteriales bacterium]|nr:hypothetical protein [Flavobacteriales bacterium]